MGITRARTKDWPHMPGHRLLQPGLGSHHPLSMPGPGRGTYTGCPELWPQAADALPLSFSPVNWGSSHLTGLHKGPARSHQSREV